jgi:hypothetical protein
MDPMAMNQAMMALQGQAKAWLESYGQTLAAAGFGFTDDDLRVIEETRNSTPPPQPTAEEQAAMIAEAQEVQAKATAAEYPVNGFAPDDPRIAPVRGISLVAQAVAARAIGWSTDDAFRGRVLAALGLDLATWVASSEEWRQRLTTDMAVAAFYGQLFSQADPLPRKAG